MRVPVVHPIHDETLVSYHRPELVRILKDLELARDCWDGLNGQDESGLLIKSKYLPKEPGEPKVAYQNRVERATYTPTYKEAIRGYAGLLGRFELVEVPPSLEANKTNVDMHGTSIQAFYGRLDEKVLRDGGAYVFVDMPPDSEVNNFLDQQRDGRSPYLVQIDRADCINWKVEYDRGRQRVLQATIRQYRAKNDGSSFGAEVEPVYYVMTPGQIQVYTIQKDEKGKWYNRPEGEPITTSLGYVPLVWYGATGTKFGVSEMPMHGMAVMSIQHYQMRSDLVELIHKCAMPVPVRKGGVRDDKGNYMPLVLGPNTAIDVEAEQGDFKFAEPHGQSLTQHQAELRHLEELMDRSSLNFLYGAEVKTATEASLRAAQVAAQVSSMVRTKVSSFDTVMRLWALYMGEQSSLTSESGIAMNDSLINKPVDPSGIAQLVNLYREKLLSRRTILDELRRGGVLDPDTMIDREEQRIKEDWDRRLAEREEEAQRMQAYSADKADPQTDDVEATNSQAARQVKDKVGVTADTGR